MLEYDFNYHYYQPPITPGDGSEQAWKDWLNEPLEIFQIPEKWRGNCSDPKNPDGWLLNKPSWAVVWMLSRKVEGYYDGKTGEYVWINGKKPNSEEYFKALKDA